MEPLNDDELRGLLRQWQAPDATANMRVKVPARNHWWKWLLTGSIRIPVPVGVLVAIAIVWMLLQTQKLPKPSVQEVTFANFQPVKELKPRIVRSHENQ